jgi:hypothetical protein
MLLGAAQVGPARARAPGQAAPLPAVAAQHVDAQMADLGTPAFVDGMAGLLLLYAGRDPKVASAIAHRVLARAPSATGEVAQSLRLAGFDPAIAGLGQSLGQSLGGSLGGLPARPGVTLAAPQTGGPARAGAALIGSGWDGGQRSAGRRPSAGGGGVGQISSPVTISPAGAPAPTGGGQAVQINQTVTITVSDTLLPFLSDLATPQLR